MTEIKRRILKAKARSLTKRIDVLRKQENQAKLATDNVAFERNRVVFGVIQKRLQNKATRLQRKLNVIIAKLGISEDINVIEV